MRLTLSSLFLIGRFESPGEVFLLLISKSKKAQSRLGGLYTGDIKREAL